MSYRTHGTVLVLASSLLLLGCPGDEPAPGDRGTNRVSEEPENKDPAKSRSIEGWYILDHAAFYGQVFMKDVPPGQVLNMAVKDGRWMMANMLSGWGGTYEETRDGAVFTCVMGPAGPTDPEEIKVVKTAAGLVLNARGAMGANSAELRYTYKGADIPSGLDIVTFLGTENK